MIKNALSFTAGVFVGVISLPATLIYVKPIKLKLTKAFAEFATDKLTNDAKLRAEAIEWCEKFVKLLKAHPDDKVDTSTSSVVDFEHLAEMPVRSVVVFKQNSAVINTAFKTGPDEWSIGGSATYTDSLSLALYGSGRGGLSIHEMAER